MRAVTEYATEIVPADGYLSDAWYAARQERISASEVAALLGLSPWVSPFDLWWDKRTGVPSQEENRGMRRGKRYESLILEDFAEDHPELYVERVGLCVNDERPWQACTPDGLAYDVDSLVGPVDEREPLAVVEAKSGANRSEWGEPGTDAIPVYYRAQVLWQMDCLGLNVVYVPVVFGFDYREYVVEYHEADVMLMRAEAEKFLQSVADGNQPDIDSHAATGRRLKQLHPDVVDGEVEVPATIVAQYHAAKRLRDCAQDRMDLAANRIRALMGDYNRAVVDGRKVASRSVYDVKERVQTVRAHTVNRLTIPKPKGD